MESSKRKALESRRESLQIKLQVREWVSQQFRPFCEILEELDDNAIDYNIHQLVNIPPIWERLLKDELTALSSDVCRKSSFSFCENNPLISRLLEVFPSSNPFRYVPDLSRFEPGTLIEIREDLQIADQTVFLFYFNYGAVLTLRLFDLLNAENDTLFNVEHGDAVIFPVDYSWLIAFSIEEEWYAGRAFQGGELKKFK